MSRTINGNLTGAAARLTLDEKIDFLGIRAPIESLMEKCRELRAYFGFELYDEWVEKGPENNDEFLQYVDDEYKKMLGQQEDALRDADWTRQTTELRHGG